MRQGRLTDEFRERTKRFAARGIRLYVALPKDQEETHLCAQRFLNASTAVAAHARSASRTQNETGFISKLSESLQATDESQLWLELLREECDIDPTLTESLQQEASELIAIMTTIIRRLKQNAETEP